jgi:hypothetical protein
VSTAAYSHPGRVLRKALGRLYADSS